MSLTEAEVQKLASLSRMQLSEEEPGQFTKEIDSILGYVEQIKEVSEELTPKASSDIPHRNILREDVSDRDLIEAGGSLVGAAPASQNNLLKVKKILN